MTYQCIEDRIEVARNTILTFKSACICHTTRLAIVSVHSKESCRADRDHLLFAYLWPIRVPSGRHLRLPDRYLVAVVAAQALVVN